MHTNIIIIGDQYFIKTFDELKFIFEFDFSTKDIKEIKTFDPKKFYILKFSDYSSIAGLKAIPKNNILILKNKTDHSAIKNNIEIPCSFTELNTKILQIISSIEFDKNSKIKLKDYILNKNDRTLTKNHISVQLTEKEITLIELLNNSNEPLDKNQLIQSIWKYSSKSETHTLETHIYRLRKKILDNFHDEHFILSSDQGYSL